jgi:hypothetical protein
MGTQARRRKLSLQENDFLSVVSCSENNNTNNNTLHTTFFKQSISHRPVNANKGSPLILI